MSATAPESDELVLLVFDKDQRRGPDGRWIDVGGDWLKAPGTPEGRSVRTFMEKTLPANVREGFKKRGFKMEARREPLNDLPGMKGKAVNGVYYGTASWAVPVETKTAFVDIRPVGRITEHESRSGPSHPAKFVAAHETGHAFDNLFSPAWEEGVPWTPWFSDSDEWVEVAGENHLSDREHFANVFAAASGGGTETLDKIDPGELNWMIQKIKEAE